MPAVAHPPSRRASLDVAVPFKRADALAAGITPKQLRGPRFKTLFTGVYLSADLAVTQLHLVLAALLIHPDGAYASHASAAVVLGAPLPAGLADVHISVRTHKDRRRRPGIRNHIVPGSVPLVRYRGALTSAPKQVFVELAGQLSLVDHVAVGDYFVRRKWVTPAELRAHAAGTPAERAAGYVRKGVDSPMETRLRMLIVLAGLPEPKVNHKVYYANGELRYRFDLSYPDLQIVVEYDGRQHRTDLEQWDHDVERGEWFDDEGWRHLPVFSWGIYKRPDITLARVVKVLRSRGCTALPPRLSDGWRPYFPVRRSSTGSGAATTGPRD